MRSVFLALSLSVLPIAAFAAGGDSPALPTETTAKCAKGLIYDSKSKACVAPKDSRLEDDTRYRAAREFAHLQQFGDAQAALAAMSDQSEDRVLTYWGFTHRRMGNLEVGMGYYARALAQNPDNILARSYLGAALLEQGDVVGARDQLLEIRARGGAGSWAETYLTQAILGQAGYDRAG